MMMLMSEHCSIAPSRARLVLLRRKSPRNEHRVPVVQSLKTTMMMFVH